ncbi:MAG: BlaI/MecI/CopY family transcriptional regulator [Oscillospiraceae bacterium]|nr:BlaI/MecI/CopY family transcriptional regulator [Oscillospiraceae bacterium]
METIFKLTNAEARLAELLWINEPIAFMDAQKLAEIEFGWKKSVTFSVLKRLIDKGLARNEMLRVTMRYNQKETVIEKIYRDGRGAYGSCLPMFIVSRGPRRKVSFFGRGISEVRSERLRNKAKRRGNALETKKSHSPRDL